MAFNSVGEKYKDFRVTNVVDIPEIQCQLRELVHEPTGAQVMHVANDDPENVFCLSFKTIPESSNGVAHILEHTVLCGSDKYPVKDPFFCMRRRSLNTFMNAMTGPDFTCYPAASQVKKDFYNLLEVYLDAVFHPLLTELSFLQEGHRLEVNDASDLEFKGVVFNEMKGSLSNPGTRLVEAVNKTLMPDLTYGCNSGGDPKDIPGLSYQELIDFHKTFYHPSRCLFYFYGDMPLEEHLDFIATHALAGQSNLPALSPMVRQERFRKSKKVTEHYPVSEEEEGKDKAWIAFSWLTCDVLQQEELLALHILETVLLDTDASPLKQVLLKSGLCTQVGSYIESDIYEVPWVIILQGCQEKNADALEKLIFETLENIEIPEALIESAFHQFEFDRSEITGGSYPFGLSLYMRSGLLKQHGAEAKEGLMIHSVFKKLRDRIAADKNLFPDLIQKYLLKNAHFVRVVMTPDKKLAQKELSDEKTMLEKIRELLTDTQVKEIADKAKALEEEQKREEDINVLPIIRIQDVPKEARDFSLEKEQLGDLTIYHHNCFTNNILYADLIFPMPDIAEDELTTLRLFFQLLTQLGCGGRSYTENLDYIQANTGGVSTSFSLNMQAKDHTSYSPYFYIQGKALNRKADKLFSLYRDMLTSVNYADKTRIKEIILKHYTALETSINSSSLNYAINLSASGLSASSKLIHECYGLPYYGKIHHLAHHFDKEADSLIKKLQMMQEKLLALAGPHLVISGDRKMYKQNLFEDLPLKSFTPWEGNFTPTPAPSQGRKTSSPVAFTSKVIDSVSYAHPDSPALNVAAGLFDNLVLHQKIREQGGAYGGGSAINSIAGYFYFYAYRDPNICKTLKAFDEAVNIISKGKFKEEDLEEAKLEIIQDLDAPIPPGSRGRVAYGWMRKGQTYSIRQAYRDRLLSLTKEDVIQAIQKHIAPQMSKGAAVTFADSALLEKENAVMKKPLKVLPLIS